MTRADVPIAIGVGDAQADAPASVGFAPDAVDVASSGSDSPVAITAWGATTVLGSHASDTFARLLAGASLDDHARVPGLAHGGRAAALAHRVARHVSAAGLSREAAVVVGTSKGAVEDWFSPPPVRRDCPTSDNEAGGLSPSGLGDIAASLSRALGTRGPVLTASAACASGLHALIRGAMMIRSGEARQVLVVATEASVHPLFLSSFQRLGVLAKPGGGCRPFDRHRSGFYMTEAAAAVLLEALEPDGLLPSRQVRARGDAHPHRPIFVDGFAMGGDATHLTGSDADARLLKHLLARVINRRPVDLIHAHGTGTELNDATELAAIEATTGDWPQPPVVYSHKAALGHSLGASGLLSVVLNCICHTTAKIPPNARTTHPLATQRVTIPTGVTERPVSRSIAVAAGFGGPTAVVGLRSPAGPEAR